MLLATCHTPSSFSASLVFAWLALDARFDTKLPLLEKRVDLMGLDLGGGDCDDNNSDVHGEGDKRQSKKKEGRVKGGIIQCQHHAARERQRETRQKQQQENGAGICMLACLNVVEMVQLPLSSRCSVSDTGAQTRCSSESQSPTCHHLPEACPCCTAAPAVRARVSVCVRE